MSAGAEKRRRSPLSLIEAVPVMPDPAEYLAQLLGQQPQGAVGDDGLRGARGHCAA